MNELLIRRYPQVLAAALCTGFAAANALRAELGLAVSLIGVVGFVSLAAQGQQRLVALAVCLALVGWWWGSARLDALDRSPLARSVGMAGRARLVVTGPVQLGRYDIRAPGLVLRFAEARVREPVLLRLPRGRAPPQGAVVEAIGQLTEPRGPKNGFDERSWLRRHGVHVVLRAHAFHIVGRRGGLGGIADALRRHLQRSVARGLTGERAAVLEGVLLGEDAGLSDQLRQRFRASGLYHLLASPDRMLRSSRAGR